ncbi:MAG: helix-turn-helix transcriptional regulator [Deltaproteobacteria bacterium]|jgi:transcriptional regulator with XRE-family HTH domain|nr:helix-turn-helix transcriptional regulator [Deltaproteobacteria bacterium]
MGNVFKDRLTQRRQELHITQRMLAKKIGRGPTTISSYESGYREPSLDTVVRMAKSMGCSVDWLLGVEASPASKESSKVPAWLNPIIDDLSGVKKPADQKVIKMMVKTMVKSLSQS